MSKNVAVIGIVLLSMVFGGCDRDTKKEQPTPSDPTPASRVARKDWCAEHGVPEAVCTRCNPKLIADFKKKGDWCKEHNLPESQCVKCNPKLEAKFKAMAPKGS